MKLNKILIATLATSSIIAAQPALAQTSGPASASVDAIAEILDSQLTLEIVGTDALEFGSVARPNGAVSGAQCLYEIGLRPISSTHEIVVIVRELRNGAVFDEDLPTPSGCELTGSTDVAVFRVQCTRATPFTLSTNWQSAALQGIALTPSLPGLYLPAGDQPVFFDPASAVVNCSEFSNQGAVVLGGTLTVDADAAVGTNVVVGTVTLNATY